MIPTCRCVKLLPLTRAGSLAKIVSSKSDSGSFCTRGLQTLLIGTALYRR